MKGLFLLIALFISSMPMTKKYSGQAIERIKKRQELLDAVEKEDNMRILALLISDCVNPNRPVTLKSVGNKKKTTPLIAAVAKENPKLVSQLLEHGADVNKYVGRDYHSPLFEAVLIQSESMVKTLLRETRVDLSLTNKDEDSALIFACRNFESETDSSLYIIKMLLTEGLADPNHYNKYNRTALFYVCTESIDATKYLLLCAANVNIADKYGDTPLIRTLIRLSETKSIRKQTDLMQIIALLLEAGADPDHRNSSKISARLWAKENNLSFVIPPKKRSLDCEP